MINTKSDEIVKENEDKKKVGRTPLYSKWITEKGLSLVKKWSEEGLINTQIANKIGINTATLYEWQSRFPEFADAIRSGKTIVDQEVESSLLQRAMGYQYEEETWVTNEMGELVLGKKVIKSQAPDTTAQIFWLKNRQPEIWRDKRDVTNEHSVTIKIELGDMEKWSK